jgi:hypothetical protein
MSTLNLRDPEPSARNTLTSIKPAPVVLTLQGLDGHAKAYEFPVLALEELRLLQQWIDEHAQSPLDRLAATLGKMPPAVADRLADKAFEESKTWKPPRIGDPEAEVFLRTPAGLCQLVTLMLHKSDPTITDHEIRHVLGQIQTPDQINLIVNKSTGLSEATPPKGEPPAPEAPAEARPSTHLIGPPSFASSPSATSGPPRPSGA